jgi:hypothetical protein
MLAQRGLELAAQVEDLVGVTQRHAAVVGELELAAALAEQRLAQPVFQQLDLADSVCGVVCSCSPAFTTPPACAVAQKYCRWR